MNTSALLRASAVSLLIPAFALTGRAAEGCPACLASAPASTTAETPAAEPGHPLRGVILEILPGKQALLVHHEEIPGVMREMTMLLKVDSPTLAAAKKNQRITATLTRRADGWWLTDVTPASAAP